MRQTHPNPRATNIRAHACARMRTSNALTIGIAPLLRHARRTRPSENPSSIVKRRGKPCPTIAGPPRIKKNPMRSRAGLKAAARLSQDIVVRSGPKHLNARRRLPAAAADAAEVTPVSFCWLSSRKRGVACPFTSSRRNCVTTGLRIPATRSGLLAAYRTKFNGA